LVTSGRNIIVKSPSKDLSADQDSSLLTKLKIDETLKTETLSVNAGY